MRDTSGQSPALSLLTCYRGKEREAHLLTQLRWLERIRAQEGFSDFEVILAEGAAAPTVQGIVSKYDWARHLFIPMTPLFHKSVLLNRAAATARGEYLIPFDVDLLPAEGALALLLKLARASPLCLITGFRLQLSQTPSRQEPLPSSREIRAGLDIEDASLLGPEENPRALRKYLIDGQRFGVCPCFPRERFARVGGCNEDYVGRGPEDQELIERVCATGLTLMRCYDLVYFHLPHGKAVGWDDPQLLAANRQRFTELRRNGWVASLCSADPAEENR
jgi:N-terminal domain of galactosyltransferase